MVLLRHSSDFGRSLVSATLTFGLLPSFAIQLCNTQLSMRNRFVHAGHHSSVLA
jgi:hypothetical protein